MAAREAQQLPGELRRALARLHRVAQEAVVVAPHRHGQVALDDGEQVVEVVRDPSREPTDGLQAAARVQLCLQTAALGDVDDEALEAP